MSKLEGSLTGFVNHPAYRMQISAPYCLDLRLSFR